MIDLLSFVQLFAAAGGGGSSSSGDGDGGILGLLLLAGAAITTPIGSKYRKKLRQDNDREAFNSGQKVTWFVAGGLSLVTISLGSMLPALGFAYFVVPFVAGLIIGAGSGLYGWLDKIKPNKKIKAGLAKSATNDKVWDENFLKTGATNIYNKYQQDWSNFNLASMQTYMTPNYYNHVYLMMSEMHAMGRRNVSTVNTISTLEITNMRDSADDNQDRFVAGISAMLTDQLIDIRSNKLIWQSSYENHEYWQFVRDGQSWRLDGITPYTTELSTHEVEIQRFAQQNGAYYSLDWGRLLMPQSGQLFSDGSMQVSDINNHVIGRLVDTGRAVSDGIIYQIYTYSERPVNEGGKVYLVGQITVPKYYGDILIRRRKGLLQFGVRGLREMTTEWADFNKKFQVFATSPEQVTSFELLNPQMMQWLEAAPFEVNLEVIGNSIYFYSQLGNISAENYATMLSILQAAYRELKM